MTPTATPESAELAVGEGNGTQQIPVREKTALACDPGHAGHRDVIETLRKANRDSNLKTLHLDALHDGLRRILRVLVTDRRTEFVFAALEAQDLLNAIDVARGKAPKVAGLLRVAKVEPDIFAREVTVCAWCHTNACWRGLHLCDFGISHKWNVRRTVRELLNLHLEPPRYWGIEDATVLKLYSDRDREA